MICMISPPVNLATDHSRMVYHFGVTDAEEIRQLPTYTEKTDVYAMAAPGSTAKILGPDGTGDEYILDAADSWSKINSEQTDILQKIAAVGAVPCGPDGPTDKDKRFYSLDTKAQYRSLPGVDEMAPGSIAFVKENGGIYWLWPSGWPSADSPTLTI